MASATEMQLKHMTFFVNNSFKIPAIVFVFKIEHSSQSNITGRSHWLTKASIFTILIFSVCLLRSFVFLLDFFSFIWFTCVPGSF